jgi:hypothetical protein
MAEIRIEKDVLVVDILGAHKLFTFKNRIEVPLANVRGATADPGIAKEWKGVRAPGMHIPGVVIGGTFFSDGERTFWDVTDESKAVVIELGNEKYDRIVIGVDEPRKAVDTINAAIAGRR